jgi:aminobenzoyl-glutamate utilization protein B
MSRDAALKTAGTWIDSNEREFAALSDCIWEFAEPSFCEINSAAALCDLMARHGFDIQTGSANMPSAFVASWGSGAPRIAVMCEYDATPGETQGPFSHPEAYPGRTSGFTDLHNGIGVASAAAAVAIAKAMEAHGIQGSVVAFGTPAEKLCAGKPLMARAGLFDELDAVVAWHPRPYSTVEWDLGPGIQQGEILQFTGKSAYSARPWTGISAIDAAVLTHVILQFLKDHLPRDDRASVSEIIARGGDHPTSIPGSTQSWFVLRAATRAGIERTSAALTRAAEAACVAIGTTVERRIFSATRPWLPNHTIAELCYRNLQRAGAPRFSKAAKAFAGEVLVNLGAESDPDPFDESLTDPRVGITKDFAGGTDDVNEFCWHAPTARIYVAHGLRTTAIPNWARSAFCRGETAHPTVLCAAKAVAYSVLDLMTDSAALESAKKEFNQRAEAAGRPEPYIPEGTLPPIDARSAPAFVREHRLRVLDGSGGS